MRNVLVDCPAPEAQRRRLEAVPGISVSYVPPVEAVRALPEELIRDVSILLTAFPPENNAAMERLELIQLTSAGYGQLYGHDFVERNVRACNAAGVFDVPIAEWCIAMMVNLARDLRGMIRDQEQGRFNPKKPYQNEIRGSTVGFWGYGGLARETARLAKSMGLCVHVLTRNGVKKRRGTYCVPGSGDPDGVLPDRVFSMDEKEAFLKGLDFLVIAVPLTKLTEGIVGEEELRALPRHALVLNPARGPIIREHAMLQALREGWIAGAALDVHWQYPLPADHPIRSFPNVVITPHISGSSQGPHFLPRIWDIFLHNVQGYLRGEPLLNELTTEQLNGG